MSFSFQAIAKTGAAEAFAAAVGIATGVVLARVLGPEGRGVLFAAMVYPTLFSELFVGLTKPVLTRENAAADTKIRRKEVRGLAYYGAAYLAGPVLLISLAFIWAQHELGLRGVGCVEYLYAAFLIPISLLGHHLLALDWGAARWTAYNVFRSLLPALVLVGLVVLWLMGAASTLTIIILYLLSRAVSVGIRLYWYRHEPVVRPKLTEVVRLLRAGMSFFGAHALMVGLMNLDSIVANHLLEDGEKGQYAVALRVGLGMMMLANSVGTVAFADAAREALGRSKTFYGRYALYFLAVTTLIVLLCPLSYFAVPVLFGTDFEPAGQIASVCIVAFGFGAMALVLERRAEGEARPVDALVGRALAIATIAATVALRPIQSGAELAVLLVCGQLVRVASCFFMERRRGTLLRTLLVPGRQDWIDIKRLLRRKLGRDVRSGSTEA